MEIATRVVGGLVLWLRSSVGEGIWGTMMKVGVRTLDVTST